MHVGIAYMRRRGKRSRHSRRMRTRNFAYLARGPCQRKVSAVCGSQIWTVWHLAGISGKCRDIGVDFSGIAASWTPSPYRDDLCKYGIFIIKMRPSHLYIWESLYWQDDIFMLRLPPDNDAGWIPPSIQHGHEPQSLGTDVHIHSCPALLPFFVIVTTWAGIHGKQSHNIHQYKVTVPRALNVEFDPGVNNWWIRLRCSGMCIHVDTEGNP